MTDPSALLAFAEQQQQLYRQVRRAYYADPDNGLIAWPEDLDHRSADADAVP